MWQPLLPLLLSLDVTAIAATSIRIVRVVYCRCLDMGSEIKRGCICILTKAGCVTVRSVSMDA